MACRKTPCATTRCWIALHLLGYDHLEDAEREEMFTLQDRLVSEVLGRPAPAPTVED